MILAPPLLDLICIRTLDIRLLCFCRHFVDQAMTCAKMNLSDFVSSVAWPGMNDDMKDCGWREALVWQHSVDDVEGRVLNQGFIRDGYGERKWMIILFHARAFRLLVQVRSHWRNGQQHTMASSLGALECLGDWTLSTLYCVCHSMDDRCCTEAITNDRARCRDMHCGWCGCNCR